MNKFAVGFLIAVIVAGNVVTITLLLGVRQSSPVGGVDRIDNTDAAIAPVLEAIQTLRRDVNGLSSQMATRSVPSPSTVAPATGESGTVPAATPDGALATRFDEVVERLQSLEEMLAAMKNVTTSDR